jgi:hypothetical protein
MRREIRKTHVGKRSSFSTMSEPNWHIPAELALHAGRLHSPEKERLGGARQLRITYAQMSFPGPLTVAYCLETLDSSNRRVCTSTRTRRGSSVPEL